MLALLAVVFDVWAFLLVFGLMMTAVTTVAIILGWTPGKRAAQSRAAAQLEMPALWRVSSPSTVVQRASASARVKAAASVRERGIVLTDVREVEPSDAGAPATAAGTSASPGADDVTAAQAPGGHEADSMNGLRQRFGAAVTPDEASAIASEAVHRDPGSVAEVITEWIRADLKNKARRAH
jgi:hypothetical protein